MEKGGVCWVFLALSVSLLVLINRRNITTRNYDVQAPTDNQQLEILVKNVQISTDKLLSSKQIRGILPLNKSKHFRKQQKKPKTKKELIYNSFPSVTSSKNWVIISFSDFSYLNLAKLWYDQLTFLGYKTHHIIALDRRTYIALNQTGRRAILGTSTIMDQRTPGQHSKRLSQIWKTRLTVIIKLLKNGYNIMMSDTDSIWMNYRKIDSLMAPDSDILHTYGANFPQEVYNAWHFTLCGCVVAYRSTEIVQRVLEVILKKCSEKSDECDDQVLFNAYYLRTLRIQWKLENDDEYRHFDSKMVSGSCFDISHFDNIGECPRRFGLATVRLNYI